MRILHDEEYLTHGTGWLKMREILFRHDNPELLNGGEWNDSFNVNV